MKNIIIVIFLIAPLYISAGHWQEQEKLQTFKNYVVNRLDYLPMEFKELPLTTEDCLNIAMILEGSPVKHVDFDNSTVGDKGLATLAAAFKSMPQLTSLSLYNVGITDEGFKELCVRLSQKSPTPPFKYIDIRSNKLGEESLKQLIALREVHKQLVIADDFSSKVNFSFIKALRKT